MAESRRHFLRRVAPRAARGRYWLAAAFLAGAFAARPALAAGDAIRIGYVSTSLASTALVIAAAKGYYAAEGLDATLVPFDAAQPIAVAVTAGDVDFGSTGLTDAFCVLASQGALKIIGGDTTEHPGFHSLGFIASNRAYAAGLKSVAELGGHSVGIPQFGTVFHYSLGRVLDKYAIDLKSVRVLALQSNANVVSAIGGGQIDASIMSAANLYDVVNRGKARLLTWLEDEVKGTQVSGTFTSTKIASHRPETVRHFLAAFRKAAQSWDAAFVDAEGRRADQPSAPAMIATAATALNQPPAVVKESIAYVDPEARVYVGDIQHMLDWYEAHGMQKSHIDALSLIDMNYAKLANGDHR